MDHEEYVEAVLSIVERIPRGRVTTYGAIADAVGQGGPRQVGAVMASYGGPVPWWRVVRADGSLPPSHDAEARQGYLEEGTPLRPSGRVDLSAAFWPAGIGGVTLTFGDDFELGGMALGTILVVVYFHLVKGRTEAMGSTDSTEDGVTRAL